MTDGMKLSVQGRAETGSAASRRLRRQGWLPGVVNTADGASVPIRVNRHDVELLLHRRASENLILDLRVDDAQERKVLLKEVQHHAVTGDLLHVDFLEISMTETMRVAIPIELTGECEGVKLGGVLEHVLREIEVECLPGDLVESVTADVSALGIGDTLTVADIAVDPTLTVLTPRDMAVVSVAAPRVVEEEAAAPAEEAEAEPEVIGEKKDVEETGEPEKPGRERG